jgi:hypothetical protein
MPDMSRVVKSEKQRKENKKFSEANFYAKAQMADPIAKAEYQAKVKDMQRPHNVAVADFYNPPQIRSVDLSQLRMSNKILIHAWDDFKVVRVAVEILDNNGTVVKSGEAVELREWLWEFFTDFMIRENSIILVRAWDKPGNIAEERIVVDHKLI